MRVNRTTDILSSSEQRRAALALAHKKANQKAVTLGIAVAITVFLITATCLFLLFPTAFNTTALHGEILLTKVVSCILLAILLGTIVWLIAARKWKKSETISRYGFMLRCES